MCALNSYSSLAMKMAQEIVGGNMELVTLMRRASVITFMMLFQLHATIIRPFHLDFLVVNVFPMVMSMKLTLEKVLILLKIASMHVSTELLKMVHNVKCLLLVLGMLRDNVGGNMVLVLNKITEWLTTYIRQILICLRLDSLPLGKFQQNAFQMGKKTKLI
jgi:hypothetical protein